MNTTIVDPEQIKGFLKAIEKGEVTEKDLEEIKSVRKLFDNLVELVGEEEKSKLSFCINSAIIAGYNVTETIVDIVCPGSLMGNKTKRG